MIVRSLRFRLIGWYVTWVLAAFLVAGVLLYFGLRHYLESGLARSLTQRARRVADLLVHDGASTGPSGRRLADEIAARFAPEASGRFIRVVGPDGTEVYRSGPPHDRSFDPAEIPAGPRAAGIHRIRLREGPDLELAVVRSESPWASGYRVEAGESLGPALVELRRLLATLGIGGIPVAAMGLAGARIIVRRALRPVDEIARSAERITSHNLGERLPTPPAGDEFEHLSLALNRMITRLDEAFQHNRRFLADASHELRTPLTVLRGELETLVREERMPAELRERLGSTLEEVERLAGIVAGLFALARLDAGEAQGDRAEFDLAQLVAATAEQMALLAEDKEVVVACQAAAPVRIEADRARIKQVVVNLLDNAIQYTHRGGRVTLSVTAAAGRAVLEVADNGIGIAPETLPHVFERFFRADKARSRSGGGAGLGLAIAKAICTAHDGRVEVSSTPGLGSRFRVDLPLAPIDSTADTTSSRHEH